MAVTKPHELFTQIEKGPLAPAYLLAGDEGYFIDRALARIVDKALAGAPRDFNLDVFYAKDSKADDVASQASTLPMLAERRVVVLKEADKMKDIEPLVRYLESPSPDTVLVLVAEGAERGKEEKLSRAVSGKGVSVHFYRPLDSELSRWIKILAKEAGYAVEEDAASYLKDVLGGNLALIEAELNKVFNFLGQRKTVTYEDVKESVGDFGMPVVFDLIDATAGMRPGEAVETLSRLLREGEPPLMVLGMMVGHWRRLLGAKERREAGDTDEQLARAFRLNFMNKKSFLSQVSRASKEELRDAFHLFWKADMALKGSALSPRLVMERLVLALAGSGAF